MLIVELALQAHQETAGHWPEKLSQLVPSILRRIPHDPWSKEGAELHYRRADDSYVLYSVGRNGNDDGGTAPKNNEYGSVDSFTGDLRLDVLYAPSELCAPYEDDETEEEAEDSFDAEQ